jgi:predicted Zn-dependent peptidase
MPELSSRYDVRPFELEVPLFLHTVLPNGLTIIAERNAQARSVALGAFVRSGARDEASDLSGISHFLEHLCFKGFGPLNAQGLSAAFDAIGSRADAYTTQEITAYHGAALPQSQTPLTALLLGMLRPNLLEADVIVEREVILEEIEMYRDDPGSVVFEAGMRDYFGAHPFSRSVLGKPETLAQMTGGTIWSYCETWYAPHRVVLAATGNLDWDALVEQASSLTASWQPSSAERTYAPLEPRRGRFDLRGEATRAHAAFFAPGFAAQDERHAAASVLAQIIGDSNSRLYWALMDDGLCDDASLEHAPEDRQGTFYGALSCNPENLELALERYRSVLETVQRDGISASELTRAKKRLEVGLALRFETPHSRLSSLAEDFIALNEYRSVPDLLEEVREVNLEEIHAILATRPFDASCVTTLTPESPPTD